MFCHLHRNSGISCQNHPALPPWALSRLWTLTAASVANDTQAGKLLYGEETVVCTDATYIGV